MDEDKLKELAKLLFESQEHPGLELDSRMRGERLRWENCGHAVQQFYIKRVRRMHAEFFNVDFEKATNKLLSG